MWYGLLFWGWGVEEGSLLFWGWQRVEESSLLFWEFKDVERCWSWLDEETGEIWVKSIRRRGKARCDDGVSSLDSGEWAGGVWWRWLLSSWLGVCVRSYELAIISRPVQPPFSPWQNVQVTPCRPKESRNRGSDHDRLQCLHLFRWAVKGDGGEKCDGRT